jgi:hypothetical protein
VKGVEFANDELVIARHGPEDIVGTDENDIEPLVDLSRIVFSIPEQLFTAGSGFSTE